jgi:hypothetical protein
MSDNIQAQIKSQIDAFARELEALVRQAALEAVGEALGTAKPRVGRPPAAKAMPAKRGPKKGAGRRSSADRGAVAEQILKYIHANPGQRSEEIRSAIGVEKNVWQPAIAELLSQKKVAKKGNKRATTYTAK